MKELEELTREIREKLPRLKNKVTKFWLHGPETETVYLEPMLNDVLEWLVVKSKEDFEPADKRYLNHFLAFRLSEWDLSKACLKDQSPELIKFLHGLIKK